MHTLRIFSYLQHPSNLLASFLALSMSLGTGWATCSFADPTETGTKTKTETHSPSIEDASLTPLESVELALPKPLEAQSSSDQAASSPLYGKAHGAVELPTNPTITVETLSNQGSHKKSQHNNNAQQPLQTAASAQLEADPTLSSAVQPAKKAKAVLVDIISDTLDYDPEEKLYIATGSVKVIVSEQNTELLGDKVMYDPVRDFMVAEGNVIIINKGKKVYGTYAKIDLTRKSALINDPITVLKEVRVKAKESLVEDGFTRLINGKLVIPPQAHFISNTQPEPYKYDDLNDDDLSRLALADPFEASTRKHAKPSYKSLNTHPDQPTYQNTLVPQQLDMSWDRPNTGTSSYFDFHAEEIDLVQGQDGYNDINLKWPRMKFKGITVGRTAQMNFAQVEQYEDLEYLGPDIGLDPDFGGAFAGPGYDFRLGEGFVRFSPIVSFGTGQRRSRRGQKIESVSGPGVGAVLNYMSHHSNVRAGYNVAVGTPTLFARRKFNEGRTKAVLAANEDYTNGFFGWERPKYIAQVTHEKKLGDFEKFHLTSFASAGVARDEFFPTNNADFFVLPDNPDSTPVTAGRVQLQAQIQNKKPLLQYHMGNNNFSLGFLGQAGLSAYSTGDYYGLFRGGPTLNFNVGNRFRSFNRYMHSLDIGDTPFVFDTYYRGRNSLTTRNQFKVNDYLTVGLRNTISIQQDNAQNALFTNNAIFMLFGPEDVKFNVAYDFIRKRSFFGINFLPGRSHRDIHYDKMNVYQPDDYEGAPVVPNSVATPGGGVGLDAFGNVRDVGMMNGNKAQ